MKFPKLLIIEAGHGKSWWGIRDPGAVTHYKKNSNAKEVLITERELNVKIGRKVLNILKEKLPTTFVHGVGIETDASVGKKTRYMNKVRKILGYGNEDCFAVSLHVNANYSNRNGIMGYYQNSRLGAKFSKIDFLESILWAMKKYFKYNINRIVPTSVSRFGRLYIDDIPFAAVLVEMGYIGNKKELEIILNQPDRLAESIAHGILNYFRNLT